MRFSYHTRLDDEQIQFMAREYLEVQNLMELADSKIRRLNDKIIDENVTIQALQNVHHMLAPRCKREVDSLLLHHREKRDRLKLNRDKQRAVFTMHAERFAALVYHYNANFKVREKIKELRS